ncbi:MAG: hypothetical protein E4G89_01815 [Methanothrix sp.]|nr:MAG: hypothetical protein E4G89_01815 [Methanothrix sp.]
MGRLLGDLPEAVKSESIPAFNLIWPPAESPSPELQPKTVLAATPTKTVQAPYASIWLRFVAFAIDGFALMIPSMIVTAIISLPTSASQDLSTARGLGLILLVMWWLYFAIMESSPKGATLGKMLLHLRVTDMKGDRISFARATGRFFGKALGILTLYIGFLIAVFTAKKQALHDLISGCLVITAKKDTAELTERPLESSNAKLTPRTPGLAVPGASSDKAVAQSSSPPPQITFDNVIGTLQEPGLMTVCPHCHASLAKEGTEQPSVRFNTDRTTHATSMYCPHCGKELQLSDLRPKAIPPTMPASASPGPGEEKPHVSASERPYAGPPVRDLTQEDVIHQLRTPGKSEEMMRVSRVVYFFCSRCKHVFKKEENLKGWRIALMTPESAPVVFGTLTCQYCGNVMQCGEIYAGQYDVPKQYWPDLPAPHEI